MSEPSKTIESVLAFHALPFTGSYVFIGESQGQVMVVGPDGHILDDSYLICFDPKAPLAKSRSKLSDRGRVIFKKLHKKGVTSAIFAAWEIILLYNFLDPFATRGGYKAITLEDLKTEFSNFLGNGHLKAQIVLPLTR